MTWTFRHRGGILFPTKKARERARLERETGHQR
jgi:hypothetical protein